jgi:uncharacterized LabA/DUF88 family protein
MGRVAIFVDGGYLDYVLRAFKNPKVAFDKLAAALASPDELLRTYYYHCLPYQSPTPTPQEANRFAAKQRFFHALRRLDRFEVREGKLEFRGRDQATGKPIFEQKRVDIQLAVDLVLLATKRQITRAVVLTGDSDFLPAVQAAKNEGVLIHLYHGTGENQPHRDLWDVADSRTEITELLVKSVLK